MSKHLVFSGLTMTIAITMGGCAGFPVRAPVSTPSPAESSPAASPPALEPSASALPSSPSPSENPIESPSASSLDPTAPPAACAAAETQMAMNDCAARLAETADQDLNEVYQTVRDKYQDTPQGDRLVDAQLAWIAFRDANCQFASSRFEGGSIAPLIYSSCVERMTKQRTTELKAYGTDPEEGDLF